MYKSKTLSSHDREKSLETFKTQEFDLGLIGGGITGAGIAREAASRGLKVALIEGSDFVSGTSSRSSKLIHGGIRYLENLEFHLVFEALTERQRLFEMAPHLVHPLRFLLPIYKTGRVPAWKMGLGMWLYDALSLFEAPELNQFLDVEEVRRQFPALSTQGLTGAFAYYDAYMDDDRLVLETLRSARQHGAELVNYCRAVQAEITDGKVTAILAEDALTNAPVHIRAKHFISSVGPWTDRLGETFFAHWKKTLRPTKGAHLTFLKSRFELHDAVVMGAENRIVFAIPRHEMVIVGTTDTEFSFDPGIVRTEPDDVTYLLSVIAKYFPGSQIQRSDIIGCYAGVRPLIDDGAQSESKTSREHAIWTDPHGVTFVAGGKYTTYRNMAQQTVELVLNSFSIQDRVRFNQAKTLEPLNPLITDSLLERARQVHQTWDSQLPFDITRALAERHGLEAEIIIQNARAAHVMASTPEEWSWCAEALHAVNYTLCLSLKDFYSRRTPLILSRRDHGVPFAEAIALVMAQHLGWDEKRTLQEINALQNHLAWELAATI